MADIRRYQPRHSRSGFPGGRRLIFVILALVGIVVIVRAFQGGDSPPAANTTNSESGIRLLNENVNGVVANANTSTTNGNTNQNTNASANTNASTAEVTAPDTSEFDMALCSNAISQFGTRKVVALTYNVAAANEGANDLLDVLAKDKIPATFFVSGVGAEKYPEFVRQLASKGFGVYNRSYDNPKFSELSPEQVTAQLDQAETAISGVTDRSSKPFFRPPFGATSDASIKAAQVAGYCTILWTVDGLDWQDGMTAEDTRARVVEKIKPGAIVMLSSGYDVTADATKAIATDLRKAGYSLVSLVELLGS